MSARLVRAIQLGDCVAKCKNGKWSVWRTLDRRGRTIGDLEASQIELMRLNGELAQLGTQSDERFVWSGKMATCSKHIGSPDALITQDDLQRHQRRPLLHRVLEACSDSAQRRRLLQAAKDYSEDFERSLTSGMPTGMNWQALAAGGAIQGGKASSGLERSGYAANAARRLTQLHEVLTVPEVQFLDRLIIHGVTRNAIATWRGLKPKQAERHGYNVLVKLADAYERVTSRPRRVRPQPA